MSTETPMLVAAGVLLTSPLLDGVWMGKRIATSSYAGFHQTPGGKIDPGEDTQEGLAREILEETGIAVFSPLLLEELTNGLFVRPDTKAVYRSVHFLYVTSDVPRNTEPEKCEGWEYIPTAKLLALDLMASTREAIVHAIKHRKLQ